MRKILFMMLMLFSVSSFAGNSCEDESTDRDVVLKEEGSKDYSSERPRSLIPISCVYVDGTILLSLYGEVGELTLPVTNQMTGERWSVSNTPVLQTSTADGTYWVEIETEDGNIYYGTFKL